MDDHAHAGGGESSSSRARPKSSPVYRAKVHSTSQGYSKGIHGVPQPQPHQTSDKEEEAVVVDQFCRVLDNHRKACEATCKYQEADVALARLNELRLMEEDRQRQALRSKHIAERVTVEEAHREEFSRFNAEWDHRMQLFDVKASQLEEEMKCKQAEDMLAWRRKMSDEVMRPKFSPELLNLRKIQSTLAKQKSYHDAHQAKLKADSLEAVELTKLDRQHQKKMAVQEEKLACKQHQELDALRHRVNAGRDEHRRQRQAELERVLMRYQNVKTALEKQQSKETADREKKLKLRSKEPTAADIAAEMQHNLPPKAYAPVPFQDSLSSLQGESRGFPLYADRSPYGRHAPSNATSSRPAGPSRPSSASTRPRSATRPASATRRPVRGVGGGTGVGEMPKPSRPASATYRPSPVVGSSSRATQRPKSAKARQTTSYTCEVSGK